jgi:RNA polymerase sigma factor (sigma-70 family)
MREMSPMTTDGALVRRLQQRDTSAWEELYATYEPRLRRFARSLTNSGHDADDLVSETFLRVLPALDRLDPSRLNLEAYLFTTTRNLFLDEVARTRRAEPVAEVPEQAAPVAIEDDPERSTMLGAQQREVRIANASLQPRQRLVLSLCELEDRSYAEIGELVGLNENAVAQLVYRARESLRTELRLLQVDPSRLPAECRSFLPLLSQYLDGQLKEPRKSTMLSHLEGCDRCQAALADMREAQRRYRTVFLPLSAPLDPSVRERLDRALDASGYWAGGAVRSSAGRAWGSRLVVVAAVVGLGLAAAGGLAAAALLTGDDRPAAEAEPAVSSTGSTPVTTAKATTRAAVTTAATKPATTAFATTEGATTNAATTAAATTDAATTSHVTTADKPPATTAGVLDPSTTPTTAPALDTRAPKISITRAPPAATADTVASISFGSSERLTTFACRLDGGAWQRCSSPRVLDDLALGAHTLAVRGTDRAGNAGQATATWKIVPPVDTTPPLISITSGPTGETRATAATFEFTADEAGSTFTCSFDGTPYVGCASPATQSGLAVGTHSFAVKATDAAGNVGSASRAWTVVAPLPDLVVSSLRNNGATIANAGDGASGPTIVVLSGVGTYAIAPLGPGQSTSVSWSCKAGTLTATVDPSNRVQESSETNNVLVRKTSCLGLGA